MKLKKTVLKKILGRWLEGWGLGITAGMILIYKLKDILYWYWLTAGVLLIVFGAYLQVRNDDIDKRTR